jgi:hypothetical protein
LSGVSTSALALIEADNLEMVDQDLDRGVVIQWMNVARTTFAETTGRRQRRRPAPP